MTLLSGIAQYSTIHKLLQEPLPAANKLHNATSRLMSNTTRKKYIFTEYWSSIIQYLNDLDFSFKVTQGQINCCHQTPHIWFPINV